MVTRYLLQRRLRHIRSITLNNVALRLERNMNEKANQSIHEIVRTVDCFYIVETVKGDPIFISEVQSSLLRQVQFNDINFNGDSTTRFNFKIVVQIPHEFLSESSNENIWCVVKTLAIDLNKLKLIDSKNDAIRDLNIPIFILDDGSYTIDDVPIEKGLTSLSSNDSYMDHKSPKDFKRSFTFNTVLKLNKLLEYIEQVQEETSKLSHKLEGPVAKTTKRGNSSFENEEDYKRQLERIIMKKRARIKQLQEELDGNHNIMRSDTDMSMDLTKKIDINDEYGNTYSHLFQTRSTLSYLRTKKLDQLCSVFQVLGLFDLVKELNCGYCLSFTKRENDSRQSYVGNQLVLNVLDKRKLQKEINKSLEKQEQINTFLGYYSLLIQLTAEKIFFIKLPYNLMFYSSTSLIDKVHPLYLPEAYSTQNLVLFQEALTLLNTDIEQLKQYLTDHYTNM